MELNKEEFSSFLNILNALSNKCTDVHLKNGNIRIRSDNKILMYDIYLDDKFKEIDTAIPTVTGFTSIAKTFMPKRQYEVTEITFDKNNNALMLKDEFSNIVIKTANESQISPYIQDEKLNASGFNEKVKVFSSKIPSDIISRIKNIHKGFTPILNIIITDKSIFLQLDSEQKTKVAKFDLKNVEENGLAPGKYVTNLAILDYPFSDNILLEIYKLKNEKYIAKVSTVDEKINVYCGIVS